MEPGSIHFSLLNDTYIIVITPYDIFGLGKYKYTFQARCSEDLTCVLPDGAVRIFLNTRGNNREEVSGELVAFLEYVEQADADNPGDWESERIRTIHNYIRIIKSSEEMGVRYMQASEEKVKEREDGFVDGARDKAYQTARNLHGRGFSAEDTSKIVEESLETVKEWYQEWKEQ